MKQMNLQVLKDTPPWDWPLDTGKALLDLLQDNDSKDSDLILGAGFAGDLTVVNDDIVGALLSLLRSGRSDEVRARAAIALGPVLEEMDTRDTEDWDDPPISERMFQTTQLTLQSLYADAAVPTEVRRRILEASVRAVQDWHRDAIRAAYTSNEESWKLTAVFCMGHVRGFDAQILEALDSANPEIHIEAIRAAANWEIDAAWPHVAALLTSPMTEKSLLLAAIEASAMIRPHDALAILNSLAESGDEDIVAAVDAAILTAEGLAGKEDDDLDDLDDF
jgi:hypothetical protein